MAQIDVTVGDFAGNLDRMLRAVDEARSLGVDLLAFPELAVCGYPPEDLLMKPQFIQKNLQTLDKLVKASSGITVVAGFVDKGSDGLYNAAAVIHNGKHVGTYRKIMLPNYGVIDEDRYFKPGRECTVYTIGGIGVGVSVCEDIRFEDGPPLAQSRAGAELILNISASPYHYGKVNQRVEMLKSRAQEIRLSWLTAISSAAGRTGLRRSSLLLDENGRGDGAGRAFRGGPGRGGYRRFPRCPLSAVITRSSNSRSYITTCWCGIPPGSMYPDLPETCPDPLCLPVR
jgi:predicted amidohydrolase